MDISPNRMNLYSWTRAIFIAKLRRLTFLVNRDNCKDPWLYKMLRTKDSCVLSYGKDIYTSLRLRGYWGRREENAELEDGERCSKILASKTDTDMRTLNSQQL